MKSASNEQQIRDLLEQKAAAVAARDPKGMTSGYAPGAVIFNLAPPLRQPGDARDPGPMEQWLAGFDGPISMQVRDLDLTVDGDVAFGTSLNCLTATPKGMAEGFTLWFRNTWGLRRLDGRWQITHEHESVPFEMDGSFAASVGLEP
jgi:ketosteroid isomerase-like protein